ncbi:MAG: hypothetical protein R2882_10705 [Gemmatimonadales bacterium]
MKRVVRLALLPLLLLGLVARLDAQMKGERYLRVPEAGVVQVLHLADGSTLVGHFVDVSGDPVRFETRSGVFSIPKADIREISESGSATMRNGSYWPDDPNPSRLFFGPTARVLPNGAADFSSTYLFLLSGSVGVGGVAQLGGGFSVLPFEDFTDNLFFATAKVSVAASPKAKFAVGGLAGWAGGFDDDIGGGGVGAVYGVGTFGTNDNAATIGLAVPFGDVDTHPIILAGGETRITRRIKLVTENYFVLDKQEEFTGTTLRRKAHVTGIFGYGVRIFGEKIAVDLAFLNSTEGGVFPGVPYVDFVVRF